MISGGRRTVELEEVQADVDVADGVADEFANSLAHRADPHVAGATNYIRMLRHATIKGCYA